MLKKTLAWLMFGLLFASKVWAENGFDWKGQGWDFLEETDGVKIYRKNVPEKSLKGVGGEALIDAPIGKLIWVLMDHDHKVDWIDRFQKAYTIEELNPLTQIQYASFRMPFPIQDRDFVYSYAFSVDEKLNAVIIDVKSVDHNKEPEKKGFTRGEIISGQYLLFPRGDKTFIQAQYLADPKGLLPTWVVNIVQKHWPLKTIEGLRKQVAKPIVREWDNYASLIKPKLKL